jgi:type I restriction enzyme S subunit
VSEELPPGWAEITLSDLGLPATPKIDPQRSATETFELYSVPSFDTEAPELALGKSIASTRQAVEPGDVLLCKINPRINRVWIVAPRSRHRQIASTEWVVVRPHGHEPRFFMWQMRAEEFRERLLDDVSGVGGSLMRARTVGIEKLRLRVPPVAEQRRIVARIEALFARIRQARADLLRITSLSERYRLTVLRAALRGELTADWRSRVGALEPAERLVARTPAPSQPRGGREATDEVIPGVAALSVNHPRTEPPPGWTWVPLLRLARQESGHTPSRSVAAYWNGDIPWIGIRDAGAHHGGVIQDTAQHVTQAGLDNSSARLLPAQTVCLSRTASVGYVVVMGRPMATSQDFVTWTCSSALLPDFLKYALLAEGDDIRRFGKGSTHTTIYFPEIRALHICLPPLAEQHEIVRLLDQALTAVGNATHDADRAYILLDHLERSILTRAFRGDLVPQDPADEPAAVTLPCAEIRSAPRGRQRGARAATYREIMADG